MSWTVEQVAERFEECVDVFRRLPDDRRLGYKSPWPEMIFTPRELARQAKRNNLLRPLPDAIDRAEETLGWILEVDECFRSLVWLRAARVPWRAVARETGFPKTTAQRHWERVMIDVARRR